MWEVVFKKSWCGRWYLRSHGAGGGIEGVMVWEVVFKKSWCRRWYLKSHGVGGGIWEVVVGW